MKHRNSTKRKQNEGLSRPKSQNKSKKSPVVKGVPAEVTEQEFKEFLDLNKINYAKAERLTGKKDGRALEIFNWKSRTTPKPRL